ncbi:MAG: hypothetical protein WAN11_07740 [Syntrophobacteraceae bacterium]
MRCYIVFIRKGPFSAPDQDEADSGGRLSRRRNFRSNLWRGTRESTPTPKADLDAPPVQQSQGKLGGTDARLHATHLLTGDLHHFGPLMNRPELACSIIVQTVTEFLAAL